MGDFVELNTLAVLEELLFSRRDERSETIVLNTGGDPVINFLDTSYILERADSERLNAHLSRLSQELSLSLVGYRPIETTSNQQKIASSILQELIRCTFVESAHTIDFTLELRERNSLVSPSKNAPLYFYLISISGGSGALKLENHDFGYHFHYIDTTRKRHVRTNALFTFNPKELLGPPDHIYWELHGPGQNADPGKWGKKRSNALRTASKAALFKPGKDKFKQPGADARLLA